MSASITADAVAGPVACKYCPTKSPRRNLIGCNRGVTTADASLVTEWVCVECFDRGGPPPRKQRAKARALMEGR